MSDKEWPNHRSSKNFVYLKISFFNFFGFFVWRFSSLVLEQTRNPTELYVICCFWVNVLLWRLEHVAVDVKVLVSKKHCKASSKDEGPVLDFCPPFDGRYLTELWILSWVHADLGCALWFDVPVHACHKPILGQSLTSVGAHFNDLDDSQGKNLKTEGNGFVAVDSATSRTRKILLDVNKVS